MIAVMILFMTVWSGDSTWAVQPDEMLSNAQLEARAHAIGMELRCLVCQNQSIEDSNADLAHDLRVLVRQLIAAGDTDQQVIQYIVARYGTYVLLKPPFNAETYFLWLGPLILLLTAAGLATIYLRGGRSRLQKAVPLSEEENRRVAILLDDGRIDEVET